MVGTEHMNFQAVDSELGPVLVSIKDVNVEDDSQMTHMILRLSLGTFHQYVESQEALDPESILASAKRLCPDLTIECLMPIISRRASHVIAEFDRKTNLQPNKFKFGIIYQKACQVNEDDIFQNRDRSQRFEEFLDFLGNRIKLEEHTGYAGGLDTKYNQTGTESVFETYLDYEIMFHVSTLLPYSNSDGQQLARKRHIGNDIVAIVFQDRPTPFSPEIISSQFLHAYIVIQPTEEKKLKISIATKSDVADFGPFFVHEGVYTESQTLKEQLLAKLINAEQACYKSNIFLNLEQRTRHTMLTEVSDKLQLETSKYLKHETSRGSSLDENSLSSTDKGILHNMRSILNKRTRSKSILSVSPTISPVNKKRAKVSKINNLTPPNTPPFMLKRKFAYEASQLIYKRNSFCSNTDSENFFRKPQNIDKPLQKVIKTLNMDVSPVSPNISSMGYIMELHAEIEHLQTDKINLLRTKLESHREILFLRNKQEELEKSLELVQKEVKLLTIGKPIIH